jgi:tetratricopeptide (TPR) repeat protein
MPVQVLIGRTFCVLGVLLCALALDARGAGPAGPQAENTVARLYEHAGRLLQEGRPELALDEYRRLADSYPQSDFADDALLAIAEQIYSVTGVDGLGRGAGAELEEAFRLFDRVRRDHPQGNAAPAALLRMALLRLEPGAPRHDPEQSRALLRSLCETYPESEWAGEARLALAYVGRRAGPPSRVVADLQPFFENLAASPLAPRAHLWRGDAFEALGRRARALESYQALREGAPRSAEAGWAQGRALLLVRRTLAAQGAARLVEDASLQAQLDPIRAASAVLASAQGWIWVLEAEGRSLLRLDPRGRLLDRRELDAPARVAFDAFDQAAIVENGRLRLGKRSWSLTRPAAATGAAPAGGAPGAAQPGGAAASAALMPAAAPLPRLDGSWWIVDERGRSVLEFDRGLAFRRSVWSLEGGSIERARQGAGDTAWLLDPRGGRLIRLSAAGEAKAVDLAGGPSDLRDPVDLAVDPLGAAWVLDAGRRGAAVFSPAGEYEGFVPFPSTLARANPQAFDIDSGGAFVVFDGRGRRLVRLIDAAPPASSSGGPERAAAQGSRGEVEP